VNVVKIHCPYLPVLIKTYHKKVCPNLYIYLLYFVVYKRHLIYVYVHLHVSRLFHVAIVYFRDFHISATGILVGRLENAHHKRALQRREVEIELGHSRNCAPW
jgi:hypothetical protein